MLEQKPKSPIASRVYAENYAILHEVADRLRNGGPDDMDSLVSDFRRAMAAYKTCHERLETIRREIDAEVDRIKAAPEARDASPSDAPV
jgi:exonuclease VII small subunit